LKKSSVSGSKSSPAFERIQRQRNSTALTNVSTSRTGTPRTEQKVINQMSGSRPNTQSKITQPQNDVQRVSNSGDKSSARNSTEMHENIHSFIPQLTVTITAHTDLQQSANVPIDPSEIFDETEAYADEEFEFEM